MTKATLLFLLREDEILLAMKKRGFGAGKWNGTGGKVEPGESIEHAALRECQEEIGVTPLDPRQFGVLQFDMADDPTFQSEVHIFVAHAWQGQPHETEEMRPKWFKTSEIPYYDMWSDDKFWLPLLLAAQSFEGHFTLTTAGTLVHHHLKKVSQLGLN